MMNSYHVRLTYIDNYDFDGFLVTTATEAVNDHQ